MQEDEYRKQAKGLLDMPVYQLVFKERGGGFLPKLGTLLTLDGCRFRRIGSAKRPSEVLGHRPADANYLLLRRDLPASCSLTRSILCGPGIS